MYIIYNCIIIYIHIMDTPTIHPEYSKCITGSPCLLNSSFRLTQCKQTTKQHTLKLGTSHSIDRPIHVSQNWPQCLNMFGQFT